ncbi:unnamed protein product [Anisakis simplex]|uniref:Gal_mutarotas_2 domain-containing protein n=1 Tax=Anisakis simplex TaxID=6269 RepID=A0A0M3JAB4_ANISI|nr:unnamed protein product [Anisakis simplex]
MNSDNSRVDLIPLGSYKRMLVKHPKTYTDHELTKTDLSRQHCSSYRCIIIVNEGKVVTLCFDSNVILQHNLASYSTWAMLARDQPPNSQYPYLEKFNHRNLYGVYPFYIAIEADHKAHGVLILNSNPQEITLGPSPHLIYRTIGGMLDMYFFPGPSPKDVIRQYLALVGNPALPAYWALGYQVCFVVSS